jgi:hypothetical protein
MFKAVAQFKVIEASLALGVLCSGGLIKAEAAPVDPAVARAHWAFQHLQEPAPPKVKDGSWASSPIDFFILAGMEKEGMQPPAPADKPVLIRRATYDLTGLPPTAEEVDHFLADTSPKAFENVVERLLASPAYGEQWGRHWLDVARYADTAGETADFPIPVAWRYRNYVIDAFNQDKPYDAFLKEQIAGDILARSGPAEKYAERVIATGFLALSRRFGFDSENYHHLTIQDTLDTLGQATLGLSLGCARCHDHKFDPIPATDYYALYGIFESARYSFPGSEQKQRRRVLAPLLPPEQSQPKWREFEARVALLTDRLEKQKQPVPSAILRSVDDMDGDFEMQAPASGGSRGVLVPPWFYTGEVSAQADAQSPFQNLFPKGKVGALLGSSTNAITSIYQGLHLIQSPGKAPKIWINMDLRMASEGTEKGVRRFWVGSRGPDDASRNAAFEFILSGTEIKLESPNGEQTVAKFKPREWINLQIEVDSASKTGTGRIGIPGHATEFSSPCRPEWNGALELISLSDDSSEPAPPLQVDNLSVEPQPLGPVSTQFASENTGCADLNDAALSSRLAEVVGLDGDFEFQTEGTAPADPWRPGPNARVSITTSAQSPFRNVYPAGTLGIHMDNSGAYDGFVQALATSWKGDSTNILYAAFDFRCADQKLGGGGSWRFYLGHGAGSSAAVELYFNGDTFFIRNGDSRDAVAKLTPGEWKQVQLALNLKERTYTGTLASAGSTENFSGKFPPSWDGIINHTFVDSYGHIGGVRPAFDGDNFVLSDKPLPALSAPPAAVADADGEKKKSALAEFRKQIAEARAQSKKDLQELEKLLTDGPMEMAYAVVEGTPHDSFVQIRGEPDKAGPVVPRGFLSQLNGGRLPPETLGSGRLEFANWIVTSQKALSARVMANRIWLEHFGRGLVTTPNDFGLRGQPPSHPELLDFLANHFIQSGWSIKSMHRLLMLSSTYQQSEVSGADERSRSHFLGFKRRRLTAEELRDSILYTSGELDALPGQGHPFPSPFSWGYSQHGPFNAVYDHNKRSVYLMQQRIKRHPFLALFDGADPNASVPERRPTTVPTQALFFLNDPFVHEKSGRLAARIMAEAKTPEERAEQLWLRILARKPSADEKADAIDFLQQYEAVLAARNHADAPAGALAALARTLFGNNEFLHID